MNRRPFIKSLAIGTPILGNLGIPEIGETILKHRNIIKPNRLKPGDLITLIAPGGPVTEDRVVKAEGNIQGMGFRTKRSKNLLARMKHTAGTDSQRLEDLHTAFSDTKTKAIWCVRGGDGCNRLLTLLDYNMIKNNPKPLIGFSDITALHNAIYNKTGLIGFHGPIAGWNFSEYIINDLTEVLLNGSSDHTVRGTERTSTIYDGKATGQLVGGNLSLMAAIAGTDYDNDYTDKIVFIEDVGEAPRRIDRMLTQLGQASNLRKAKGIIFGEFDDCFDASLKVKLEEELEADLINLSQSLDKVSDRNYLEDLQNKLNEEIKSQQIRQKLNEDLKETIKERFLSGLNIPILYDFPFSHDSSKEFCTFPVGIKVELNATEKKVKFLESAVL